VLLASGPASLPRCFWGWAGAPEVLLRLLLAVAFVARALGSKPELRPRYSTPTLQPCARGRTAGHERALRAHKVDARGPSPLAGLPPWVIIAISTDGERAQSCWWLRGDRGRRGESRGPSRLTCHGTARLGRGRRRGRTSVRMLTSSSRSRISFVLAVSRGRAMIACCTSAPAPPPAQPAVEQPPRRPPGASAAVCQSGDRQATACCW
jgi:hypothetical protein